MIIFLIALIVIAITYIIKNYFRPKNYPLGPPCLPFIGSWYSVPAQGIENEVPKWRKQYGNIIGHKIGSKNLVIIAALEEAMSALKHSNFQNRIHAVTITERTFFKVLGLFFGDGEQYHELRRFTVRFLGHVASATKLEPVMHEEMMDLFSTIKSGQITHVNGEFTTFSMNIIFNFLCGDWKKSLQNETTTYRKLIYRSFKNGRPSGIENFYPLFRKVVGLKPQHEANTYAQNFFIARLQEHRETYDAKNIRDFIDALLLEQEKEKEMGRTQFYTDEELISCLMDLGGASSESIGNTAAFLLMYVSLNPHVQDKMHEELDRVLGNELPTLNDRANLPYCTAVIYETLRINTIGATGVQHIVTKDTEFYGYTIPQGTTLIFPFRHIFLDPNEFDEPNSFKPERFFAKDMKSKVIGFGLGKRSCVGELISKNLLFLFVTYFFQKYFISLAKGHEIPNVEPDYGFTNSPKPFKLIMTERKLM